MPSSFSPNLRVELIGDGEQYDSWGDTTNENLGTVLEDAIAGLVTVSVTSAAQALTIVDGSADQARNAILSFTTTTGADFGVYAPPVSKLYVINNASAYVATIYNSTVAGNTTAAGAGVAVPAGTTMAVWSNGTDFVSQITHIPSAVLGSGSPSSSNFLRGDRVWSAVPDPIPSGTKMMFVQTAAPTGWTKDTTHNNKALRVVSGTVTTGGTVAFTTAFSSKAVSGSIGNTTATNIATTAGGTVNNTTLTEAQMPSHSHTGTTAGVGDHAHSVAGAGGGSVGPAFDATVSTGRARNFLASLGAGAHSHTFTTNGTGSSNAHNHSFSGTSHNHTQDAHNHTFTGTAIDMAVQYVDVIIATKD